MAAAVLFMSMLQLAPQLPVRWGQVPCYRLAARTALAMSCPQLGPQLYQLLSLAVY